MVDWGAVAAISGASIAAATILGFLIKEAHPKVRTARLFIRHLIGVPANPVAGQPRVPGLFERLDALNARLDTQDESLTALGSRLTTQDRILAEQNEALGVIQHEVQFNNGTSVKDSVTRIEAFLKKDQP